MPANGRRDLIRRLKVKHCFGRTVSYWRISVFHVRGAGGGRCSYNLTHAKSKGWFYIHLQNRRFLISFFRNENSLVLIPTVLHQNIAVEYDTLSISSVRMLDCSIETYLHTMNAIFVLGANLNCEFLEKKEHPV